MAEFKALVRKRLAGCSPASERSSHGDLKNGK